MLEYTCPHCKKLFKQATIGFVCGCLVVSAIFHSGDHLESRYPGQQLKNPTVVLTTSTAPSTVGFNGLLIPPK